MKWNPCGVRPLFKSATSILIKGGAALLMTAFVSQAQAAVLAGAPFTIYGVFVEGASGGGITINEPELAAECNFGIAYVDLTQDTGEAFLSFALTAKAAGLEIARIDIAKTPWPGQPKGRCDLTGLHVY